MTDPSAPGALATLRRFMRTPTAAATCCDLCAAEVADEHDHLLDPKQRKVACACRACALLFSGDTSARYRRLESRKLPMPEMRLSESEWDLLDIPVRLVFLCPSSVHDRVFATYPSPAGAVEANVPSGVWQTLVQAHPALSVLKPDVEALIADGRGGSPGCCVVSIDVCHQLLGLLRANTREHVEPRAAWREMERVLGALYGGSHA